jgi:hypothetical protein
VWLISRQNSGFIPMFSLLTIRKNRIVGKNIAFLPEKSLAKLPIEHEFCAMVFASQDLYNEDIRRAPQDWRKESEVEEND